MLEPKVNNSNDKLKNRQKGLVGAARREKDIPQRSQSVHSRLGVVNSKASQPQQPAAFGRGISTSKTASTDRRPNSMQMPPTVASRAGKKEVENVAVAKKGISVPRIRNAELIESPAHGGFAKLLESRKPVVVTYEMDEAYVESGHGNGMLRGGLHKSTELRGESEHLYMGDGADVISEDQLDRLLLQAKKAKSIGPTR